MSRTLHIICLLLPLLGLAEPALANKFETISGGVSGLEREKVQLLQQICLYAGGFFFFLAVAVLLTRNRFEGFAGYSSRKDSKIAIKGAAGMATVGVIFTGLGLL